MARSLRVQLPPLDTGPVPLGAIREQALAALVDVLDSRRGGRKALFLDQPVSSCLSYLDTRLSELLAEHGILRVGFLDDKPIDDPQYNPAGADNRLVDLRSVLCIVRASLVNAQRVAALVKSARRRRAQLGPAADGGGSAEPLQDFAVFFVPRTTVACERVLEEEGVAGDVLVGELGALELLAVEDDVLSLELDHAFKECVVDGDSTSLFYAARALLRLQAMFGTIPRLQGQGPAALAVRDMAARMRRENPGVLAAAAGAPPRIHRAVLIDREVDLVTPMMSQITLEGLVDEVTGIKGGAVPWAPRDRKAAEAAGVSHPHGAHSGAGLQGSSAAAQGSTLLNSTDPYYREFRDLPFHIAISRLQAASQEARREYQALGSKDTSQLRNFVKGLPKLMLLDRLSDIAQPCADLVRQQRFHDRLKTELDAVEGVELEAGLSAVEELMFRGADLLEVLRLLVLLNETGHGLPRKALDALRSELLVTYGHGHVLTLGALERAGFLRQATPGKPPFSAVRKALRLVVADAQAPAGAPGAPHEVPATDISHIFKGYAPLSIRLVEQAVLRGGWAPVAETLAMLPGPSFDVVQEADSEGRPVERPSQGSSGGASKANGSSAGGGALGSKPGASGTMRPTRSEDSLAGPAAALGGLQHSSGMSGAAGGAGAGPGSAGGVQGEVVLVMFLGGVTFSEISALRWLSTQCPHRFLVLTTKIINGSSLLSGFVSQAALKATAAAGLHG